MLNDNLCQKQKHITLDLNSAIDEDNNKIEFRLANDTIKIDWIQFNKYSQIARCKSHNGYTIEYLCENLYHIQQEYNIKEENIKLFFKLIQEERGEILNNQYCDLRKLAEIFQINPLKKLLINYLQKNSQNIDLIINLMIEHQSFDKCDLLYDVDYITNEMENCLFDNVDQCISNINFDKLNISSIYRIIEKSKCQKITSDLLYDFISQSIHDRYILLNFLDIKTLSDNKFNDLCNNFIDSDSSIKFLDYLPNDISYLKSLRDSNNDFKNEIDQLKNKNKLIDNEIIEKTKEFETKIDQLKKENNENQLTINKIKQQNNILLENNKKITNDSEIKVNQLEKEKSELKEMIEQLKQENNKNKLTIKQLNEKNKLLENENTKKVKELETRITQLEKEKIENNEIIDNLRLENNNHLKEKEEAKRIKLFINLYANLDQLNFDKDQIDQINTIIQHDCILTEDQNDLLLNTYKSLVKNKRDLLLEIESYLNQDILTDFFLKVKKEISTNLKKCCIEFINIIDNQIIPRENDIGSKIFYETHKGDFYRYICESDPDDEIVNKAQQCYDKAFEIAKDKIPPSEPFILGLVLNYSVFIVDIKGQKQKAIEISQKACDETKDIDDSRISKIISLIRENISIWESKS